MTEQELFGKFFRERAAAEKAEKIERFRHLNPYVKHGQIVFSGSSLMEQFPINELLQDFDLPYTIYNRGVGGFTTSEMLQHLKEMVYDLRPAYLFLNIGTNDLNGPQYSQNELIDRYGMILENINNHVPGVKNYLLAYYPVNPDATDMPWAKGIFAHRTNERSMAANCGPQLYPARL